MGSRKTIIRYIEGFSISKQQTKLIEHEKEALKNIDDNEELELYTYYKVDNNHKLSIIGIELLPNNLMTLEYTDENNEGSGINYAKNLFLDENRFLYEEKDIGNDNINGFIP